MLAKREVEASLKALDIRFKKATSPRDAKFLAKLAILELSGWTEEAIDDIVVRVARRRLRVPSNVTYVQKQVVDRTYGFSYDSHVRQMLCRVVGVVSVEILERRVNATLHLRLQSALSNLKIARDPVAHTHTRGVTPMYQAPSAVLGHFVDVYAGLRDLDRTLRALGL